LGSIVDRIFGWFSGSRKEAEPVAEEDHVAAMAEEHDPELRSEENVYGLPEKPVDEEDRAPDFDYDDEVYDDYGQPEEFVDEMERASAFRHEDRFPPLQEQDESEAIDSMKPMWLREKKEEES
jgi:hypothetical protein